MNAMVSSKASTIGLNLITHAQSGQSDSLESSTDTLYLNQDGGGETASHDKLATVDSSSSKMHAI